MIDSKKIYLVVILTSASLIIMDGSNWVDPCADQFLLDASGELRLSRNYPIRDICFYHSVMNVQEVNT